MLDTVKINHVQHISFTQSRLTDAVSVILSELLSYEHPSKARGIFLFSLLFHCKQCRRCSHAGCTGKRHLVDRVPLDRAAAAVTGGPVAVVQHQR